MIDAVIETPKSEIAKAVVSILRHDLERLQLSGIMWVAEAYRHLADGDIRSAVECTIWAKADSDKLNWYRERIKDLDKRGGA